MIKIKTKLEKYEKVVPQLDLITFPDNVTVNTNKETLKLELKPVEIPIFSGDYKAWISFRNLFDSMVHNVKAFTSLDKMHYLKSCLAGEAEDLISEFDVTEEAYLKC